MAFDGVFNHPEEEARGLNNGLFPGGIGAALATTFHDAGHHVYATARDPAKLKPLADKGIITLPLDISSADSIASAVSSVSASAAGATGLDILVNNAAASYSMPVADVSLREARKLFDTNVWGHIAVTQAFLPLLLLRSSSSSSSDNGSITTPRTWWGSIGGLCGGSGQQPRQPMIVNHTSVGSVMAVPFQSVYNASKAALAMLSQTLRMELAPFGVRVMELKTGGVRTNIIANNNVHKGSRGGKGSTDPTSSSSLPPGAGHLPADSIYAPARSVVGDAMSQEGLADRGITPEQWAREVTAVLLGDNPPQVIWKGESATLAWAATLLPSGLFEGFLKMTKLDEVERILKEDRHGKSADLPAADN
ncbi:short-chain dehydrogenase protein [Apiospora phragmitis]|uniref:Short-chain dehydrogenase protein n=1 Tax=Apiospora phragmitis TaxID=2905665 RepID=A0ABR1X570_9PEZI